MIFSGLIVAVGVGVIIGGFYLWNKSNFNQFVVAVLILGGVITGCTLLGMFAIKDDRPCVILMFQIFILIVTL